MPKFLQDDLKLFNGIVSDLFPKIRDTPIDYGDLDTSIRTSTANKGLEDVEGKREREREREGRDEGGNCLYLYDRIC